MITVGTLTTITSIDAGTVRTADTRHAAVVAFVAIAIACAGTVRDTNALGTAELRQVLARSTGIRGAARNGLANAVIAERPRHGASPVRSRR